MKKLLVLLFLLLSEFIFGQDRMSFEGLEFTLPQSIFEDGLVDNGWRWTEDYCYRGTWLENERDLKLEWNGDNLEKLTLIYVAKSKHEATSDFYNILDYYKNLPSWKISKHYRILYQGKNEIVLKVIYNKTIVEFIDIENENIQINQNN